MMIVHSVQCSYNWVTVLGKIFILSKICIMKYCDVIMITVLSIVLL